MKLYSNPIDAMIDLGSWVGVPQGTKIRVLDNSDPLVVHVEVTEGPYQGQKGYATTDIIPAQP
jgi:hypothetical protein